MTATTTHSITAEDLENLPDGYRHQLIKGELLTMPLPNLLRAAVTMNLSALLISHVRSNNLGRVLAECGFKLETDPDTVLGPDIAFIAHKRIGTIPESFYPGAPDLAVEVFSP